MKFFISSIRIFTFVGFIGGFALRADAVKRERAEYLMGTVCEIVAYGADEPTLDTAVSQGFERIAELESVMSNWRKDSELALLNHRAYHRGIPCSWDLFEVIERSISFSKLTGGAFDVTVGPLIDAWDLRGRGRQPTPSQTMEAFKAVGYQRLKLDRSKRSVAFGRRHMSIDLGGIGKGYAVDEAAKVLRNRGVQAARINFGGQIFVFGKPEGKKTWLIEVANPFHPNLSVATLELSSGSVSTSSQLEHFVNVEKRSVGHILDPRTGLPVDFLGSVTVIAASAVEADALSTGLLVLGPDQGLSLVDSQSNGAAFYIEPDRDSKLAVKVRQSSRCSYLRIAFTQTAKANN